jgi:glycosyltransferase involved in cell wall biosynthesis
MTATPPERVSGWPIRSSPERPLRVALINDIGRLGGIESVLLSLTRHLPRDQFTPVYFAPEPGPMADLMSRAGAEVVPAPRPAWWSTGFHLGRRKVLNPAAVAYDLTALFAHGRRLVKAMRAARVDLVHSSGMMALLAGGLAARAARLPHLAHVHDIIQQAPIRWAYQRAVERVSDRVVAVSRAAAHGFSPSRTAVIPNAADPGRPASPAGVREALGLWPDQRVIGLVGRLTPWKGQRVFLAAAKQLLEQGTGPADRYHFLLVGDDSVGGVAGYREELERAAAAGVLRGRVSFLGRRADVPDVMAACDVVVHASTKPEPFGVVIVEAMAVGTPVIAAGAGGPLDIIADGTDGLLTPPGDAAALARAIRRLCDNPDEARRMADRAREKGRTVYSAAAVTEQVASVYRELAAPRGRRGTAPPAGRGGAV